jgi:hypothetical protein
MTLAAFLGFQTYQLVLIAVLIVVVAVLLYVRKKQQE